MQFAFKTGLTYSGNVENMEPVQNCTGFIFCTFHVIVLNTSSFTVYAKKY